MKLKLKTIILVSAIVILNLYSADITGIGYAQTNKEAKKEALSDLAQVIKSEVRSNFESTSTNDASNAKSNIKISSDLPILGAEFNFIDRELEVEAHVRLTPSKVKSIYVKKLSNLKDEIDSTIIEIDKSKSNSLKLNLYSNIFSLLKEYDRYESVLVILRGNATTRPSITKAKVKSELEKLSTDIDSIKMASSILASSFKKYSNVFVYPPLLQNTTMVSEFGSSFYQNLKANINTTKELKTAKYLLVGEYSLSSKTMVLNYELLDTQTNKVVVSKTININKRAYGYLKTKPKNINFDALLNAGITTSSNLRVSLNSNKGSQNLLFNNGEEIELFVKLNKQGYVYIVGYTQTNEGKMSYLLELQEGMGNSKFIKFVNADDASRWISLGAFVIEPPFGIESIQVIASNHKLTSLPNIKYNENSGYYVISNDIKKVLLRTRGLKRKLWKKAEFSEDVMSFTTIKK